ncbi:MAG: porin [Hyphomicrobiaceae bacterium]
MTTSRFAIAAVATALMGSSALAADLGGNCCADLEERIAELEATTVRKGNRKVSVQLSGWVGHNVMMWDDGIRSDMYIGDGGNIYSRFRFKGSAKISSRFSAGFTYEFGIHSNAIGNTNQTNGGDDLGGAVSLRDSTVWLRDSSLGMVKIGHGSTATDNLILIDLGGVSAAGTPDIGLYMGGMFITAGNAYTATTWSTKILGGEPWDTTRRNHILYESPTLHGFTLQASVAEDNFWDVALRYAGEFNGVRVAFGIGYLEDSELNRGVAAPAAGANLTQPGALDNINCLTVCNEKETQFKGSASVMHVPTGLFVNFAAGTRERDVAGTDGDFWHLTGGIARNHFGIGNTVLFGEYGEHSGLGSVGTVNNWGIGVNQHIDAAAMEVFLTYKNFSYDGSDIATANDLSIVLGGARIKF